MKLLKKILRVLILTHIFPLIGLLFSFTHKENLLIGYGVGWAANLVLVAIFACILFLWWVFEDEDSTFTDSNYY